MSLIIPGTGPMTLPSGSVLSASPATGDRSAAIATMQKFADEFGANLASPSGYQKLPNGLIIQWGEGLYGTDTAVSFPIMFPTNNAFKVIICPQNFDNGQASPNKVRAMAAYSLTKTGFIASSASGVASNASWIAIGN